MSIREAITTETMTEMHSYMEARNPDTVRFCEECGEECKTGQRLWNGWFVRKGLYHMECMPTEMAEKYGLRVPKDGGGKDKS